MSHSKSSTTELNQRVALVHDFLIQMGGAEKVVEIMAETFSEAPIYTSATKGQNLFPIFASDRVINSWMQKIPGLEKWHKQLFFLYPFAFKNLSVAPQKDTIWLSSSSFSKWLPKPKGSKIICYCHTPPRFFWSSDDYLRNEISNRWLRNLVTLMMPFYRESDKIQSEKIDLFVANSEHIQKRIEECYDRESLVIYPPVNVERFQVSQHSEDYYLIVSRLVSYKRIDIAVEACSNTNRKLIVIGDGPDRERLEAMAGPTIEFLGRVSDEVVEEKITNCRGLIFPGLEDFGITPVEAQACGKPVIAFRGGGALETVIENETGVFYDGFDPSLFQLALDDFEQRTWNPVYIRRNSERFSETRFIDETRLLLELTANSSESTLDIEIIQQFEQANASIPSIAVA